VSPKLIGRSTRLDDASGRYVEFVKNTFPKGKTLDGLKIVVDCANGAAYGVSRNILWELGAEVIALSVKPDGFNINENCGSTHPQNLVENVLKEQADIGIALDGDADRLLIVDNLGNIIEGDQIIAAIAADFQQQQKLSSNKIVVTSMSNLGLEHYINSLNLELVRTQIGDRYVSQAMRQLGANVGGEQSGHIILGDYSTTGDGLVAALQVLNIIISQNKTAAEVCKLFEPLPQILRNVNCSKSNILQDPKVQSAINAAEIKFNGQGRILVRNSGTQSIVRIMAENANEALMQQVVNDIAQEIINA
jgi:phosphoglucosamine mutase